MGDSATGLGGKDGQELERDRVGGLARRGAAVLGGENVREGLGSEAEVHVLDGM